jgi:hypothetical protein
MFFTLLTPGQDDFIIITRALEKEHIDEVIKTSESYKEGMRAEAQTQALANSP